MNSTCYSTTSRFDRNTRFVVTRSGECMQQTRLQARNIEKQKRKRKRNTLLVLNLLMLVLISGLTIGGAWTGLLDLDIFTSAEATDHRVQGKADTASQVVDQDKPGLQASTEVGAEAGTDPDVDDKQDTSSDDTEQSSSENTTAPPVQSEADSGERIKLTFVGDIINAGKVAAVVEQHGYGYPYTYVEELFREDDITIANLETPITSRGVPVTDKEFVYKSSPKMAPAMKAAGIDIVNLANNHILDQGEQGLLDTFSVLEKSEIDYVGAGKDIEEAYSPVIVQKKGISVAVFGFSRVIPEVSWYAGKDKPGVAATYDPVRAVEAIKKVRDQVDLIVVIPHWGKEKVDEPVDYQRSLAKAYIDAGADLIVGGHPHVLQGFENYNGKWIVYSMGNFIFTRAEQPKTWETMVLEATYSKDGQLSLQMTPYYTELGRAVPMGTDAAQTLIKRIEGISYDVSIDEQGNIYAK